MSHFTVLVIGDDVEEQLVPFQESDCPQEYLVFQDQEKDLKKQYNSEKIDAIQTKKGYIVAIGNEKKKGPRSKQSFKKIYPSFDDFAQNWHDMEKDPKTGKYGYWTNPNAKWDWYQIGGRWANMLKLKPLRIIHDAQPFEELGLDADAASTLIEAYYTNEERYQRLIVAEPVTLRPKIQKAIEENGHPAYPDTNEKADPLATMGLKEKLPTIGRANQCYKSQLDLQGLEEEAIEEARETYRKAMEILKDLPPNRTWNDIVNESPETAKEIYWAQPRCLAWLKVQKDFGWFSNPDAFLVSKEDYLEKAKNNAMATFAVLKNGQWYEKGEMGWFGLAANEKAQTEWHETFHKLLKETPDDVLLTIVDCHI